MRTLAPGQASQAVSRYSEGAWCARDDVLAVEEPLEIRVLWDDGFSRGRHALTVTMRTPGNDFELTAGLLFAEGIVRDRADVTIRYCEDVRSEEDRGNTVLAVLRPGLAFDAERQHRNLATTSACGVCGKASLDALEIEGCTPLPPGLSIDAGVVCRLPDLLRDAQGGFSATGGSHATGLFRPDGTFLALREDIGRHNAFDKAVGARFLAGELPTLSESVAVLSGRASFELLQKATMARIPILVAIGAPSTLAVRIAERFNITLAGFTRASGFNVYSGRERIVG